MIRGLCNFVGGGIFIEKLFNDKKFYKEMISIAFPIAMQNLISSSLNMIDTVIIGGLGAANIAAIGLANQVFFLFSLLLFGINSGTAIFTAQFWGKKDIKNIRRVLGIALISGCIISLIFTIAAFFTPSFIMSRFSRDPVVINLGAKYLKIISISYIITTISTGYGFACRSVGQAKLPMIVSAISLAINSILNYGFIYGKLGLPGMGIKGSATATLIARIIELSILLWVIYKEKGILAATLREMLDVDIEFVRKFFKTTTPVILNEGLWSLGTTMYSVAYARISTEAIAAVQISGTIQNLFMVVFFGMGNACAVMIGHEIGRKNNEKAIDYAKKYSIIGPSFGVIMGIILALVCPFILKLFNVSQAVRTDAHRVLIVFSIVMSVKIFNSIMVVGILRSGGDTKFSLILEGGSMWLVGVPMAFIGALILKLPVYWVAALITAEEIVKASIGIPRVISKRWVKNVVEQM